MLFLYAKTVTESRHGWAQGVIVVRHQCFVGPELTLPPGALDLPLARMFHSEETSCQRKTRPLLGRGDVVAASPDFVGPTGRRFHTRACEIFGLDGHPRGTVLETRVAGIRLRRRVAGNRNRVVLARGVLVESIGFVIVPKIAHTGAVRGAAVADVVINILVPAAG